MGRLVAVGMSEQDNAVLAAEQPVEAIDIIFDHTKGKLFWIEVEKDDLFRLQIARQTKGGK